MQPAKYQPSKEEQAQMQASKRDRLQAVQDSVTRDSRELMQVYGARGMLSGSPLSLR